MAVHTAHLAQPDVTPLHRFAILMQMVPTIYNYPKLKLARKGKNMFSQQVLGLIYALVLAHYVIYFHTDGDDNESAVFSGRTQRCYEEKQFQVKTK